MFVARQPIFNKEKDIYGYELLFRNNKNSFAYDGISAKASTASVIDNLLIYGIEKIAENKKAFINFNTEVLLADFMKLLSPDDIVIELLEDIQINESLNERLNLLKDKGYQIALDDFEEEYKTYPLTKYAKIIKIDIMQTPLRTLKFDFNAAFKEGKILLAEKVETQEEFELAKMMGFKLFQGYFFSKPQIVKGVRNVTKINPIYFEILNELQNEEPSFKVISDSISKDPNLVYKLLSAINRKVNFSEPITSVNKAIAFLGLKEMNYWMTLLLMQNMAEEKPKELMRLALVRSNFLKAITVLTNKKEYKNEASLMGLLSNLDGFLDEKIEDILKRINVTQRLKDALLEKKGYLGTIYKIVLNYEIGNWDEVFKLCEEQEINSDKLNTHYFKAIKKASKIVKTLS